MSITVYHRPSGINSALAFGLTYGEAARHKDEMEKQRGRARKYQTGQAVAQGVGTVAQIIDDRRRREADQTRENALIQNRQQHQAQMQANRYAYGESQRDTANRIYDARLAEERRYAAQQSQALEGKRAEAEQAAFQQRFDQGQADTNGFWREGANAPAGALQERNARQLAGATPWRPDMMPPGEMGPNPGRAAMEQQLQNSFKQWQEDAGIEMVWSNEAKGQLARLNTEYNKVQSSPILDEEEKSRAINQLADELRTIQKTPRPKRKTPQEIAEMAALKDENGIVHSRVEPNGKVSLAGRYKQLQDQSHKTSIAMAKSLRESADEIKAEARNLVENWSRPPAAENIDPNPPAVKVVADARKSGRYGANAEDHTILNEESVRLAIENAKKAYWSQNPLKPEQIDNSRQVMIDYKLKKHTGRPVTLVETLVALKAAEDLLSHMDANLSGGPVPVFHHPVYGPLALLAQEIYGGK